LTPSDSSRVTNLACLHDRSVHLRKTNNVKKNQILLSIAAFKTNCLNFPGKVGNKITAPDGGSPQKGKVNSRIVCSGRTQSPHVEFFLPVRLTSYNPSPSMTRLM